MKKGVILVFVLLLALSAIARAEEADKVAAYLGESFVWEQADVIDLQLPELVPVYAAPSEDAWRGANGKAAVSLTEPFIALGSVPESNWMFIEYEVSDTERRMGYIQWGDSWPRRVGELSEAGIGMTLSRDAILTDDPRASGRAMAELDKGVQVSALGYVDEGWLYVETAIGGKAARGFIPMASVSLPELVPLTDVMDRLDGVWGFSGGGEILGEGAIITADGSLLFCDTDDYMETPPTRLIPDHDRPATYAVYATHPEDRRFWSEYVIVLQVEDGSAVYGLSFFPGEDGEPERMHIETGPSGGFYTRYDVLPTIE